MVTIRINARNSVFYVLSAMLAVGCFQSIGCSSGEEPDNTSAAANASNDDTNSDSHNESSRDITSNPSTSSTPSEDAPPASDVTSGELTPPAQPENVAAADTSQTPTPAAEAPQDGGDSEAAAIERLENQLAEFKVPPAWLDDVQPAWSTDKPWKEGRKEIRRLLGVNDESSRREAIKLTWDYLQKNDIGDRHEYGMYMFLGGEPLWAIIATREYVARTDLKYPPYFGLKALASLYVDYGVFSPAEDVLKRGLTMSPPDPKWNEMRHAEIHDALGDLYLAWGKIEQAKASFGEAIRLYPLGKPPYGRHLLPRRAKKVQSKLDLLSMASLTGASLKDGTYRDKALGYSGDINLTIRIQGGRIADIKIQHQEKIDQNACVVIPKRIIDAQSLQVDGISGATVTKSAIVGGTLRGLKQAGLK